MVYEEQGRIMGEDGTLTDEELDSLDEDAIENAEDFRVRKEEEAFDTQATKEYLMMDRGETLFTLYIFPDGDKKFPLKVKRMTDAQRVKFNRINALKFQDIDKLTEQDIEDLTQQSYALMAELIVEPKWTVAEWKKYVDLPLLNYISNKISILAVEMNDAVIIEEFKKKPKPTLSFS